MDQPEINSLQAADGARAAGAGAVAPDSARNALLGALLDTTGPQLGAVGHALYRCIGDEAPVRVASSGDPGLDEALRHVSRWAHTGHHGAGSEWLLQELSAAACERWLLVSRFSTGLDRDGRETMAALTAGLDVHSPTPLEKPRPQGQVVRLARAEKLQRALYRIADLAGGERPMDQVMSEIHDIVSGFMYAKNFFIVLYDAENGILRLPYFRDERDRDRQSSGVMLAREWEGSLTLHMLRCGCSMMGPTRKLLADTGLQIEGFGPEAEAWLGVPMRRGSRVTGALVVQSYDPERQYDEDDRALLRFVAQHVAIAMERLRSHEELEQRVKERTAALATANRALQIEVRERKRAETLQAALFHIAELGSTTASLEVFYRSLHGVIGELIHAPNLEIALLTKDGELLEVPYAGGQYDLDRAARELGNSLHARVLRTGQAVLADAHRIEVLQSSGEIELEDRRIRVWLGVPLVYDGRTLGVMSVHGDDDSHAYGQREQDILMFVSYHVANALQRKHRADTLRQTNRMLEQRVRKDKETLATINETLRDEIVERQRVERRLHHVSLHDALTGLPNRNFLTRRLESVLDRNRTDPTHGYALLFLDLDRFKLVNDSAGHAVGDELLRQAGLRILENARDSAVVARLGGDEFAILLEDDSQDMEELAIGSAERILQAFTQPLQVGERLIYSTASIGIALDQPQYASVEEPLRDADVALYRAKANGRRRYELFDETLRHHAVQQLELDGDLRRALARNEFEPMFQPILDLADGRVLGFEALLRWRHPECGLMLPGEFLAQAEDSGLLEEIDWRLFELALSKGKALLGGEGYLGINVGAWHLRSERFVPTMLEYLERADVPPHLLRIEVTERSLLADPDQSRELMQALCRHGITLALDDFGTGYSSLSYLHQFPLQALKIDRSFIAPLGGPDNGHSPTVLRAVHALGIELGLEVIAEGIETRGQLEQLRKLGHIFGQGFLLARPAPAESLQARRLVVGSTVFQGG